MIRGGEMGEATKIIVEQAWTWGDTLNTISTFVIAFFAILVWIVYKKISDITGAQETHSEMMLKIEAKRCRIPAVWWDPTIAAPPVGWKHDKEINLEKVYIYIPKELRKYRKKKPLELET